MKRLLFVFLLAFPHFLQAQRITAEEYISIYKDIAIREMREHKIPASITLAQGLLESGCGNSELARVAKNHFGIKCHKEWTGNTFTMDDDEKNECFRSYENAEESFVDHSLFLVGRNRYAALFDLEITDYEGWAKGLKAAGYATNPKYAQLLIARINQYDLTRFDREALNIKEEETTVSEPIPEPQLSENQFEDFGLLFNPDVKSAFEIVDMTDLGRFIYLNNGVKFIYAKEGETPKSIAKELGIPMRQIADYNYISSPKDFVFLSGDVVYIVPLKNKCKHPSTFNVDETMTMRDVALRFAVKLDKLQKYNKNLGKVVKPGTVVKLKR
ncbi:MAG: glucosaminidase domain-containing protein [bacterium]|nr:glucosaminidase domain-containing protein [Candidatus Limimorpha equi]